MSTLPIAGSTYDKQLSAAKTFITERDHFLVVAHLHPDGDAAGSTVAVGLLLEQLGKTYVMVNEGSIPRKLAFLPNADDVVNYEEVGLQRKYNSVICIDCADDSRIGDVRDAFTEDAQILNIDHHPTNDGFGSVSLIRTDAAATVEILYDLFQAFELTWNQPLATAIYTGLLTDTGGFRYSNTTPHVMAIAAEMLRLGVDGHELANNLLEKSSFAHILLLKKALSTLTFSDNNRLAWVMVTAADMAETGATNEDFEGIVNYPRNIDGVEVGLLFKETAADTYKVGFRSAGKVDVAQLAKSFGGGGHVRAAGCTLNGTLDDVVTQVTERVRSALQ
ncbi:exopolyphosphatase [Paenibacillus swuensis]|uniref:Exopolyphosphatase n=1 Tax=Paenibacillus swuensis TaxID=1178515 RepID=A0A172TKJ0_9BACL|nr:bifunctional oligoribonuclease/PAP phosphatase NrnA [Paenibacillus swuensis]ANE47579.1 exopolyphosphatase [Paenibacillus swuensis]